MRRPAVGISTAGPYRPDIDGLRAVAVIAVILFHARVPGFEGGYVGVDVFFVLSGYLITAQLLNAAGMSLRSMLAQFYVRRARRILPALFVVLAVVVVTAGIMLLPNDLERLGRDTLFSVIFAGNIAAWTSAGYFEIVLPVPLVHLWTIGVEEQFCLFFPLALWIALRYFRDGRLAVAVGGCALASFVICLWGADAHPRANFYWAPPRAWELLLGAVLAIRAPAPVANRLVRELLAAAAAATILLAIFLYDDNMWYPYFATLAPCVATVGLIFSGLQSPPSTNRILAIRPLVFIGLISYSLYLWHVPLQTFFEYYTIRRLDTAQTIGWLGATFVLAVASWMFIEKPIRERRYLQTTRHFVACLGIVAVALVVVGMLYWRSGGLPQRTPQSLLAILDGRNRWAA